MIYPTLREKIAAEKAARAERYATFEALAIEAHNAGMVAADSVTGPDWNCGASWVDVRPATSSFAHWARRNLDAGRAYGGGLRIWPRVGLTTAREAAYVRAYATVLRGHGIKAFVGSHID